MFLMFFILLLVLVNDNPAYEKKCLRKIQKDEFKSVWICLKRWPVWVTALENSFFNLFNKNYVCKTDTPVKLKLNCIRIKSNQEFVSQI